MQKNALSFRTITYPFVQPVLGYVPILHCTYANAKHKEPLKATCHLPLAAFVQLVQADCIVWIDHHHR